MNPAPRLQTFHLSGFVWWCLVACLLATIWQPTASRAQESSDEAARAERYYQQGVELYEQGQYERAVDKLRESYSLVADPLILYNVSMAQWRAGDTEVALETGYRVREQGLDGKMQPTLHGRLRAFERILRARESARRQPTDPPPAETNSTSSPPTSGSNVGALGWVGFASATAGVVSLGGAVAVDRALATDAPYYERAASRGDAREYRERLADLERRQTRGRLLLGGGIVLTATGGALLIAELLETAENARALVAPRPNGLFGAIQLDVP